MSRINHMKLDHSSILKVNLDNYNKDFSFIVNGNEFKTSRLISELLSPKIVEIHLNDPTIDTFIINTREKGDFSIILDLVSFSVAKISENELGFIIEVLDILNNDNIKLNGFKISELNTKNVINKLQMHMKYRNIYKDQIEAEI